MLSVHLVVFRVMASEASRPTITPISIEEDDIDISAEPLSLT